MEKLIQIITITKNNINDLERTLNSFKSINPELFRVVIVSGSTNNNSEESQLVIFYKDFFEIIYKIQIGSGIFAAMNEGINASKYGWLQFINAGDEIIKADSIFNNLNNRKYLKYDAIFCKAEIVDKFGNFISYQPIKYFNNRRIQFFLQKIMPDSFSSCHQAIFINYNFHINNLYKEESLASDAYIIDKIVKNGKFLFFNTLVSKFYAEGISSLNPETFDKAINYSIASIRNKQFFRPIKIFIKYLIFSIFRLKDINKFRKWRYQFISEILRSSNKNKNIKD